MTNREIYDSALRLVCETDQLDANGDYEERATYLIPLICHRYASLDRHYRSVNGLKAQEILQINCFPLTTVFPLADAFAPAVTAALAGLLVMDENAEMSQKLSALSDRMIEEIKAELQVVTPYQLESIASRYVF
ncbi:MAG: hypothetical protein IKC59_08240 [Clostridia bacterium]|nr:hypothetical protein [Clostridia bacterium]